MATKTLNIALDEKLIMEIDATVKKEMGSRSEYFRKLALDDLALRREWAELFDIANVLGRKIGITSEQQVYDTIADYKGEKRISKKLGQFLALVFGGTPREVTDLIAKKVFRPVMSEEILSELRRVIVARFPQYAVLVENYEKLLRRYAIWVPLGSRTVVASRDPDDNKVIETAAIARCSYIISGDNDLLILESYEDIKIVKPAEFIHQISNR